MSHDSSPYYPPRAPWYRGLREAGYAVLCATRLHRVRLPGEIALFPFVLGLLIPGWGFRVARHTRLAGLAMGGWVLMFLGALATLGFAVGSLVAGALISIHATAVQAMLQPTLQGCRVSLRLLAGVILVAGLIVGFYLPLQAFVGRFVAYPLHTPDGVVVVRPGADPQSVRRGEVIAFRVPGFGGPGFYVQPGFGIGRVLAVAGDGVELRSGEVSVNGRLMARGLDLGGDYAFRVTGEQIFAPSRLRIEQRGAPLEAEQMRRARLDHALILHEDFLGRPYRQWFLRPQPIP